MFLSRVVPDKVRDTLFFNTPQWCKNKHALVQGLHRTRLEKTVFLKHTTEKCWYTQEHIIPYTLKVV